MAVKYVVSFNAGDGDLPLKSGAPRDSLNRLASKLKKLASGNNQSSWTVDVRNTATAATGTITLATCGAGTVIDVNGVEFRAIASGTPTIANGEFVISGTDTADATSLAAAINGSTDARISGVLTATSDSGVVTLTPAQYGKLGNAISIKTKGVVATGTVTCAAVDVDDTVTINGTTLTGKQQRATGTLTAASAVAADTCVVNGVTFTGVAGAVTLGSTNFSIDTGDTETATSLAAQINACTDGRIAGVVTATSAAGVVTVRAVSAGTGGNAITLVGTAVRLAASGATLSGGAAVANNQFEVVGTNTQVAADLARCINASSTALVSSHVYAVSTAAVVTLYAKYVGTAGNCITLASSDGTDLAVSGARLSGGTEASSGGAQATGTLTLASVANGETCTVNGVTFTAHTNTDGANQFRIDGDDTADAAALCRAINNSTTALAQEVVATSSSGVVTLTARRGGLSGNAITIASGQGTIVASGARLTGGAAPTTVVCSGTHLASGSEDTKFSFSF
jgi:hypothetical protein